MLEALGLEGCSETKTALENALHDRRGQFLAVGEDAMPPTMLTMIALRKNDLALVHRELLVPASNPLVEALQLQIGRAACRERVCQYVEHTVVAVALKKHRNTTEAKYNNK